ncbi:MAG: PilZ domain-containing protein [Nitrospirota bacterium]|nr:PilZ domain-containing protein [Nitrospirota bacterium]
MRSAPLLETDSRRPVPVAQKDRRRVRRATITPQQVLPVVIRCGQGTVCKGRLINVSAQGMLVEFSRDQIPPVGVDAKVDVKLHYLGDSIWLPGLVRHRMGRKMGFHFPALANQPKRNVKHPLTIVLHSLSRAVASAKA